MPTRLSANQALDDAATGLRCATLQPGSLTGVDPSRRPPVVALPSLQTQHANSSTHAAKPNANAHTPLPARARQRVVAFQHRRLDAAPDWARASPDSDWDSSFAV
jgi:hypothetical protein